MSIIVSNDNSMLVKIDNSPGIQIYKETIDLVLSYLSAHPGRHDDVSNKINEDIRKVIEGDVNDNRH